MPPTLTRAPDITSLITRFSPPAAPAGRHRVTAQPPFAVRNREWLAKTWKVDTRAPTADAERERDARWKELVCELKHLPCMRTQNQPVPMPPPGASAVVGGRYPVLNVEGITRLYPELAGWQCDDTLPPPSRPVPGDAKVTRRSDEFQYFDGTPHAPSAPPAGVATLQLLQPVH